MIGRQTACLSWIQGCNLAQQRDPHWSSKVPASLLRRSYLKSICTPGYGRGWKPAFAGGQGRSHHGGGCCLRLLHEHHRLRPQACVVKAAGHPACRPAGQAAPAVLAPAEGRLPALRARATKDRAVKRQAVPPPGTFPAQWQDTAALSCALLGMATLHHMLLRASYASSSCVQRATACAMPFLLPEGKALLGDSFRASARCTPKCMTAGCSPPSK